jgi:Skp family chaperone for outer membrane proteins
LIKKFKSGKALKQTKIDNLKEQLENERPLLTPELIEEKEDEINFLQQQLLDYQETKFGASGEFIVQKRQLIQPIEDQVFNAVQEIGNIREYDFIFENSAEALLLFSAERHDISDRVLKMINRSARDSRRENKLDEKKEEQEKNPLQEIANEPYKSVKDAKADEEKEKERQKQISERERLRDSIRVAREKVRDSIRNARQEAFEKRRQEAQHRRDSIRKARENNK